MFRSNDTLNRLEHVTVSHGGGSDYYCGGEANVCVGGGARLDLSDVHLEDSAAYGLWTAEDATVTTSGVTWASNADGDTN